ncbi:MAG TPA: hypothetical protein VGM56_24760 [Byssovorax sp.]
MRSTVNAKGCELDATPAVLKLEIAKPGRSSRTTKPSAVPTAAMATAALVQVGLSSASAPIVKDPIGVPGHPPARTTPPWTSVAPEGVSATAEICVSPSFTAATGVPSAVTRPISAPSLRVPVNPICAPQNTTSPLASSAIPRASGYDCDS